MQGGRGRWKGVGGDSREGEKEVSKGWAREGKETG